MNWSYNIPVEQGLYWYKQSNGEIGHIEIDECLNTDTGAHLKHIIEWWNIVEWQGPITPTQEQGHE